MAPSGVTTSPWGEVTDEIVRPVGTRAPAVARDVSTGTTPPGTNTHSVGPDALRAIP